MEKNNTSTNLHDIIEVAANFAIVLVVVAALLV